MKTFLLICLVVCGCSPEPEHSVSAPAPSQSPAGLLAGTDCTTNRASPEGLACGVFHALRTEDAHAFVDLFVQTPEDIEALGAITSHPPSPKNPDEIRKMRERTKVRFGSFLAELRRRGIDPTTMDLVEIRTDRAQTKLCATRFGGKV